MKKILLLLFLTTVGFAQEAQKRIGNPNNDDIYGTWQSWDGSTVLYMNYRDGGYNVGTFYRMSTTEKGKEVHEGNFSLEEKYIYVQRENKEYRLLFYLKGVQLIVSKPGGEGKPAQAWLFNKVSNYGL